MRFWMISYMPMFNISLLLIRLSQFNHFGIKMCRKWCLLQWSTFFSRFWYFPQRVWFSDVGSHLIFENISDFSSQCLGITLRISFRISKSLSDFLWRLTLNVSMDMDTCANLVCCLYIIWHVVFLLYFLPYVCHTPKSSKAES